MIFSNQFDNIFLPYQRKDVLLQRKMERFLTKYRTFFVASLLTLFGIAMGLETFVNHMLFRTYGLDLGIYAQTAHSFGHLRVNNTSLYQWEPASQLGDHFDLLLALLGPLSWIVRADWLLLAVQLLAVMFGSWGIYRLTHSLCHREVPSLLAMMLMMCQYGVWHAMGYDYHSSVVAASLLPWLILELRNERFVTASLLLAIMAMAKESIALWLVTVLLALLCEHRRQQRTRRWLLWALAGTTLYFIIATMVVMPALGKGASPGFSRYNWMGDTMANVALHIITHPLEAVRNIFTDFVANGDFANLKTEFFLCTLASGLLLAVLKPNYLLMLVVPLTMKMLSSDAPSFWGIAFHYNIEICISISCAAAVALATINHRRLQTSLGVAAVLLALTTTLYSVNHPLTPIRQANVNILRPTHYRQTEFDVATARKALSMIPHDASVCAATPFVPHIAARDSAYIFPICLGNNAEYYLIFNDHWCYYEGEADMAAKIIADTTHYEPLLTDGTVHLVRNRR